MKRISILSAIVCLAILFIFSCKKEKNDVPSVDYGSSSLRTTVTGIVLDESNAPLNGVTVTAYGQTTSTNQYGTFVLKNINANKDRCVLQFAKAGFFNRAHGFIAAANTVNYVRIVLLSNAATQSFSSSVGGLISLPDGSSAAFQPNSFVTSNGSAYTGTVNLLVKHLSRDDVNFGFMIPGGDLLGKDLNDKDVALYTYGMLGVELTGSSGEALQLANGTSATLTMTIAASQLATAPATIPLWFFDETTSLWKEEGSANKIGNNYVGTVSHFSWWNCDYSGPRSYIKGKVVDCNGVSVTNVVVSLNGCAEVNTDQNGEYNTWIPSDMLQQVQIQVLTINNNGIILDSQPENVPSLSDGQVFIVPDLLISCNTRVIGNIKSCTGENSDGFVSINKTNFYNYQFTVNGAFSLPAPENEQMVFYAGNSSDFNSQNIVTLVAPNNLNLGNVLLCDPLTSGSSNNIFVLNGGPFSNQTFDVTLTGGSAVVIDSVGFAQTKISIIGTALPDFTILGYNITVLDTVPGSQGCYVNINMTEGGNSYFITSYNLWCDLNEVGTLGNKIKGTYYGAIDISVNGGTASLGNISGSFDVIRTQ